VELEHGYGLKKIDWNSFSSVSSLILLKTVKSIAQHNCEKIVV